MASDKPESGGFLAVIEAKIAALQALAESYRTAVSVGALGPAEEGAIAAMDGVLGTSKAGASYELPSGALLGKSIPAAIKLYLSAVKKKQTAKEIVNALREGGIESTASSFDNTVGASLTRLKNSGELLRFKDGWGLAEFYPEHLRHRIGGKDMKPRGKKRKSASRAKAPSTPKAKADDPTPKNGQSIDQRIEGLFRHQAAGRFSPKQVASALGEAENQKAVAMAVARLSGRGKIVKGPDGLYGAAATH